jgi:hypothetical protein
MTPNTGKRAPIGIWMTAANRLLEPMEEDMPLLRRLFGRDVVCGICGATVNRRESHIVTPLAKGRCCTNCYPTVVLIKQEMEQKARDQRRGDNE